MASASSVISSTALGHYFDPEKDVYVLIIGGETRPLDTILRGIMLYTWDIRMMALMTRPDSLSAIASLKRLKS